MDSSFFLTIVAAAIGFFMLLRKLRFHQVNKEKNSSSPPSLSTPPSSLSSSSSLSLSSPPSSSSPSSIPSSLPSLSQNWDHNVFPSFHGPDVRKGLLSHLLEKFRSKGIKSFIDNEIQRGEYISPELKRAIRGSQIAIVLLSKNYASSSWCLDELVEIMKKEMGQKVITIFYEVDPTDVKKQTGHFGEVFRKTCKEKTKVKSEIWREALENVATIAGYDLKNWYAESTMIETIATDISNMLNMSTLSCGLERFIGMGAHIEKMRPLLRMDSDEVRMIGIWGPPGIGKSTIARFLFHKLSNSFQLRTIMKTIKVDYPRPCLDDHKAQKQLQSQMLSQMLDHKDMVIPHLGVAKERLQDKKVLLILDDVDRVAQLDALAKTNQWFGHGSRIIIITENLRVLTAHGINHIYTVDLPSDNKALQMFCMYAFGQNYPKDGFREISWQVVLHAGKLPLGLKVMGSYFRGMTTKQEWKKALPKVWRSLDGEIGNVLEFSYDALDIEEKALFLHIACFFVGENIKRVEGYLAKRFRCVSPMLDDLAKKSLIFIQYQNVWMHDLLAQFGREIVLKESPGEPGKRQFLVDSGDISEILAGDATGSEEVIGINFDSNGSELDINGGAFEGMSNLQFLKIKGETLHLPHGLSYLSPKLRLLHWKYFPTTCLPSNVNLKFLVELNMMNSKLEKLWDGIKPLPDLKRMYLSDSKYLEELPNLSTATNLQELDFSECSSLVVLPSSIGNFIMNLYELDFTGCSSLSQIPSSIGNGIDLRKLNFSGCSSLVELPASIGNLHKLGNLIMNGCSKLEVLPVNVNLKSLHTLDLCGCSSLKRFPEISTNINYLKLDRTAIEEVPSSIRSWSRLEILHMRHCKNLKKFAHSLDSIAERDIKIQKVSPLVPHLGLRLILFGCKKLLSLSQLPDFLSELDARYCESLERLDCCFRNPILRFNFANCFKLNKEARDLIIQTCTNPEDVVTVLPGKEIPTYFNYRANGDFLVVDLKERPFPSSLIFKACILLVSKNDVEEEESSLEVPYRGMEYSDYDGSDTDDETMYVKCVFERDFDYSPISWRGGHKIYRPLTEHLYIFRLEVDASDVPSNELYFDFKLRSFHGTKIFQDKWVIKNCGVHYGNCEAEEVNEGDSAQKEKENGEAVSS